MRRTVKPSRGETPLPETRTLVPGLSSTTEKRQSNSTSMGPEANAAGQQHSPGSVLPERFHGLSTVVGR